ncbi:GTPase HflX [Criblamydia sequanensis]|uniref:GTPase HflX n=1 Tax=Candidatus Criblamydia sequanensis CRIB-18 TaxID=1437425 RepID=A0A090D0B4_9BACT|nr:GTPase HflX [Criblamydia sequanensis]CDR34957.1 GTP-binding protein [Criblamydia sequanensis CRIB-18]
MTNTFLKDESQFKKKNALLVSSYQDYKEKELCLEHLKELHLLCETFGLYPLDQMACHLRNISSATFLSKGKLEEIKEKAHALQADVIVFDDEITPGQQRNLEKLLEKPVIDRTEIIIGVFADRAETKEARLQVELAELKYQAPRLKRMWTHLSRQAGTAGGGKGGGGGYLKGEGEKQIEIDRRILKRKIAQLENEIAEVRKTRNVQRAQREKTGIPVFAIIGYTNAGKSTLLNALTGASVFVEDKLFATLDTTTRKFTLDNNQEILLIDTVGFIRKLPHHLVAAFKSTLEEALRADILIHLIDSNHKMSLEHAEVATDVLKELGAKDKPIITVLNKIDLASESGQISKLRLQYPKTVRISALKQIGFEELKEAIKQEIKSLRQKMRLRIPQNQYHLVSEVIREGTVLSQEYDENDILMEVNLPHRLAGKLKQYERS